MKIRKLIVLSFTFLTVINPILAMERGSNNNNDAGIQVVQPTDNCMVCLEPAADMARENIFITSCCKQFLCHQCYLQLTSHNMEKRCPHCRCEEGFGLDKASIQINECIRKFKHGCSISAVALATDKLVTGSPDGIVKLWDLKTGNCIQQIKLETPVSVLALTPEGKLIVGSYNGTAELWNVPILESNNNNNNREIIQLQHPNEDCNPALAPLQQPNNNKVIEVMKDLGKAFGNHLATGDNCSKFLFVCFNVSGLILVWLNS